MPHHRLPVIAMRAGLAVLVLGAAAADAHAQKVITQSSALA